MMEFISAFHPLLLFKEIEHFLEQGGAVLIVIMMTTFLLWLLIIERHFYLWQRQKRVSGKIVSIWKNRSDKHSWFAHQIRTRLLSIAKGKAEQNLSTIKAVVAIAPLLGLLGTVTGMIDVFDVMAFTGSSNSRAMAAGVSKATIPTMAGMVVSLSGLLFSVSLQRRAQRNIAELENKLVLEDK
ncbi:MotA/TolQ/ExbB proton channel family protein [Aurantivibrio infirmus]